MHSRYRRIRPFERQFFHPSLPWARLPARLIAQSLRSRTTEPRVPRDRSITRAEPLLDRPFREGARRQPERPWLDRRPDAAVMRGDRHRRLVEGHDSLQAKDAPVELFDIVAANGKPERHGLIAVTCVDGNKRVTRTDITREPEDTQPQISVLI